MDPARKRKLKYLVILILVLLYGGLRVYRINTKAVHFLTKTGEHLHASPSPIREPYDVQRSAPISPELKEKLLKIPTPVVNELFMRPAERGGASR